MTLCISYALLYAQVKFKTIICTCTLWQQVQVYKEVFQLKSGELSVLFGSSQGLIFLQPAILLACISQLHDHRYH